MTKPDLIHAIESILLPPDHPDAAVRAQVARERARLCVMLDPGSDVAEASAYLCALAEAQTDLWVNWKDVSVIYCFAEGNEYFAMVANDAIADAGSPGHRIVHDGVVYVAVVWR